MARSKRNYASWGTHAVYFNATISEEFEQPYRGSRVKTRIKMRGKVRVEIDLDGILAQMGAKACRSARGKSQAMSGAVKVTRIGDNIELSREDV